MNKKELQKKQDKLDEEMTECPECGRVEKWGFLREWKNCEDCVSKYHRRIILDDEENKLKVSKKLLKELK